MIELLTIISLWCTAPRSLSEMHEGREMQCKQDLFNCTVKGAKRGDMENKRAMEKRLVVCIGRLEPK